MRSSFIAPLVMLAALVLYAQQPMPRMTSVEPDSAKAGDIVTVSGEHLSKGEVVELYLTDGKKDTKVVMTVQEASAIKFKVPDKMTPGRFALMVLTGGKEPKLIEQPVKVTIEE
ncbi:MAG TPA: IPT/TIG domain-containing protein [Bryobacteraceae bacterium]|nr:IPT/TIG domain-containing protein [Bryobacteraceae bacterium]